MRTVPLIGTAVRLAGALDIERTRTGLIPRRLPAWTRPQLVDPNLRLVVPRATGVRLMFRTDARDIELDVFVTRFRNSFYPPPPAGVDLVVDGDLVATTPVVHGTVCVSRAGEVVDTTPGTPETIRFAGLPTGWKDVELWLPHAAIVELRELRLDGAVQSSGTVQSSDVERSTAAGQPAGGRPRPGPSTARRWIHYGSSISQCAEAYSPTRTWPALVARRAGLDLTCLGFSGSCHLDAFVARTIRDLPADVITLKVGINVLNGDTLKPRTFVPALHGFLDTVRDGHPDTPIVLASPVVCPTAEDRAGPTSQDDHGRYLARGEVAEPGDDTHLTLRGIRRRIVDVVTARDDERLWYLDGLSLFGPADTDDLYDGLHPNAEGYLRIGERFFAAVFGPDGLLPSGASPVFRP